jgi:hypothetical protein
MVQLIATWLQTCTAFDVHSIRIKVHKITYVVCLKSSGNGTRKQNIRYKQTNHMAAIQEYMTVVLRSIPKEPFADSFQNLYERCQQCVAKDGGYFEGQ